MACMRMSSVKCESAHEGDIYIYGNRHEKRKIQVEAKKQLINVNNVLNVALYFHLHTIIQFVHSSLIKW